MQLNDFDRPVINLHELTNGLEKYYSLDFGREIVSKRKVATWGYYQSLEEVVRLLASVDHYKVSRLAHYHLRNRQDPVSQTIPFYQYLNENFYIIACKRHNVFEHALSMTLNKITKKLNVYSVRDKFDAFKDIYRNQIDLDTRTLTATLDAYKNYLDWSETYFDIGRFFYYDEHLENIEKFILDLPLFQQRPRQLTWQDKFGLSLEDWNRCHNLSGDIGHVFLENQSSRQQLFLEIESAGDAVVYQKYSPLEWPPIKDQGEFESLPAEIKKTFQDMLPSWYMSDQGRSIERKRYLEHHVRSYQNAQQAMQKMIELDIMISPPPIKKQTLEEKKFIIRNFDQCLDTYNSWAQENPLISPVITRDDVEQMISKEKQTYQNFSLANGQAGNPPAMLKLQYQSDDHL